MSYEQVVEQAAVALKTGEAANWELARLTYENTVNGGGRPADGKVSMEKWCADVHTRSGHPFSEKTGRRYKLMWERYGVNSAHGTELTDWTERYRRLRDEQGEPPDRFTRWALTTLLRDGLAEDKFDAFKALVADPAVAQHPGLSEALKVLAVTHARELKRTSKGRKYTPPPAPPVGHQAEVEETLHERLDRVSDVTKVLGIVNEMARSMATYESQLASVLTTGQPIREGGNYTFIRSALHEIVDRAERVRSEVERWLAMAPSDLDEFLRDVLKEGNKP